MTIIATQLTNAGISMVADSKITFYNPETNNYLSKHPPEIWKKIIHVPSISAGLAYWGCIGEVRNYFFDWINNLIEQKENYSDLKSFADYIKDNLNDSCGNKPLGKEKALGIHISGYAPWNDDVKRPFFYHIHNGHELYERKLHYKKTRNSLPDELVRIEWDWKLEERKLFSVHQDFPKEDIPLDFNLTKLEEGYVTTNGVFLLFQDILIRFYDLIKYLNKYDDVTIPSKPDNLNLQTRILKEGIRIYTKCQNFSNLYRLVGEPIKGISIDNNGIMDV